VQARERSLARTRLDKELKYFRWRKRGEFYTGLLRRSARAGRSNGGDIGED